MENTDNKKVEDVESRSAEKVEISVIKDITETQKERSFKEGLADNSNTDTKDPQQK